MEKRIKVSDIVVGERHRKSFGDLKGLAHSIKSLGLLQAIGVTRSGNKLLFGERRLRAVQMNGDEEIDCRILDIDDILSAEDAENRFRQELAMSEKAALAEEMERRAEELHGKNKGGRPRARNPVKPYKGFGNDQPKETKSRIAAKAGFSDAQEMSRVQKVVKKAIPEVVEALDQGKISVNAASQVADRPPEEQKEFLDSHRKENGKIRPRGLEKSQAVLWTERMEEVLRRVMGVREQFGGGKEMLSSALWASSTIAEKRRCIDVTVDCSESLSQLANQLKKCKKEM